MQELLNVFRKGFIGVMRATDVSQLEPIVRKGFAVWGSAAQWVRICARAYMATPLPVVELYD